MLLQHLEYLHVGISFLSLGLSMVAVTSSITARGCYQQRIENASQGLLLGLHPLQHGGLGIGIILLLLMIISLPREAVTVCR